MRVRDGGGTPRVRRTVLSGRGACTGGSSGTVVSVPSPALMGAAPREDEAAKRRCEDELSRRKCSGVGAADGGGEDGPFCLASAG